MAIVQARNTIKRPHFLLLAMLERGLGGGPEVLLAVAAAPWF